MKKLLNKKGFTLMEMLIVVAIIVILVAISIPTFSGSLDSSKVAADQANLRSAKAAVALHAADGTALTEGDFYDIKKGEFTTGTPDESDMGQCKDHSDCYIAVINGEAKWTKDGTTAVEECK